jgi:hypothetical protein
VPVVQMMALPLLSDWASRGPYITSPAVEVEYFNRSAHHCIARCAVLCCAALCGLCSRVHLQWLR